MDELLEAYGRTVQAPHRAVAGSMLVKMIGRSLPALWKLLSVHNVCVRFALPQVTLVMSETDTTLSLHVPKDACTPLPQLPGERDAARDEWLRSVIDGCLRPLLEAVSFRSGLSKAILWEDLFIYLHHAYGEWTREAAAAEEDASRRDDEAAAASTDHARIAGDYAALTREGSPFHLPSSSFPNPLHPDRELRIRRTCCLQHALPSGNTCYSCPNLCDAKRKEIYLSKK
jgi:ferric iron reductase protein FhuF